MSDRNPILQVVSNWFKRNFSDPEAVSLFFVIVFALFIIGFCGSFLAPILVAVLIAYMLNSVVKIFERWKLPHIVAVLITFVLFLGIFVLLLFWLFPLIWRQTASLINEMPKWINQIQAYLTELSQRYPKEITADKLNQIALLFKDQAAKLGQWALGFSLATIPSILSMILYVVLVPLMVFFFLKDRDAIVTYFTGYMPAKRTLVKKVWGEIHVSIGHYVRGRILEIIIISTVTTTAFALFGLPYALLLGCLVGLSVIVPYVGVVIVTIPVTIVALLQWGLTAHTLYFAIVYAIIAIGDGNVLVPLLFSETMDMHPVAIIIAVLVFGGLWGFWGVFLSIPLAALVKTVLEAWPKAHQESISSEL